MSEHTPGPGDPCHQQLLDALALVEATIARDDADAVYVELRSRLALGQIEWSIELGRAATEVVARANEAQRLKYAYRAKWRRPE